MEYLCEQKIREVVEISSESKDGTDSDTDFTYSDPSECMQKNYIHHYEE